MFFYFKILDGPEKSRFLDLSGLLGEKDSLNVGKNTSLGDGDTSKKRFRPAQGPQRSGTPGTPAPTRSP